MDAILGCSSQLSTTVALQQPGGAWLGISGARPDLLAASPCSARKEKSLRGAIILLPYEAKRPKRSLQ